MQLPALQSPALGVPELWSPSPSLGKQLSKQQELNASQQKAMEDLLKANQTLLKRIEKLENTNQR